MRSGRAAPLVHCGHVTSNLTLADRRHQGFGPAQGKAAAPAAAVTAAAVAAAVVTERVPE
ncbi:hypothetical protein AMOR_02110 [Anaeromyxobacter oryzae]|uniref:Uncharacterized protein n=1 Tax=Anaeromyxobacter oryzae TaxID=2918170 RepID=A0ABM7WP21_9BACT|nr:hypothetical protein AMOR_02110 [Anaeromyxobacter oryzae]